MINFSVNSSTSKDAIESPLFSAKFCHRCRLVKSREEFHNSKNRKDGKHPYCVECHNFAGRELARKRREERERLASPQDPNTKMCPCCSERKSLNDFYTSPYSKTGRNCHCKQCIKARSKQRYHDDTDYRNRMLNNRIQYYRKNPEKSMESKKRWMAKYPDRARESIKKRNAKRISTAHGLLEERTRQMLSQTIKNGVNRIGWRDILGYEFEDLKIHIENQFMENMSWDLVRSREIEIDHIIPRCSFYYEIVRDDDFKKCWALENLRPLWRKDNRSKGFRLPDGRDGRKIGRQKRDAYELRLAQMAAGGSEIVYLSV